MLEVSRRRAQTTKFFFTRAQADNFRIVSRPEEAWAETL
jgi:hypothetical protein